MKDYRLLFLLLLGLTMPLQANALEHWYVPTSNEELTLVAQNSSLESESLWISGPIKKAVQGSEIHYEVPAKGFIKIPMKDFEHWNWIHVKAQTSRSLRIFAQSPTSKTQLSPGTNNHWQGTARSGDELVLLNTTSVDHEISLLIGDLENQVTLPAFSQVILATKTWPSADLIIKSRYRLAAFFKNGDRLTPLKSLDKPLSSRLPAAVTNAFFLLSNQDRSQSFVVSLTGADLISKARNQVQFPDKYQSRILIGQISWGHAEFNRDWNHISRAPWSWHVTHVLGFSQLASQECDGSPEFVDEYLKPWLQSGKTICFWNYRIIRELTADQVRSGK